MYIRMPNNYTIFLDNSLSNYEDRLQKVSDLILDYGDEKWSEYFESAWLRESRSYGVYTNKTRDILDRAATFLLMGQFKDAKVLTHRRMVEVASREIPMSNATSDVDNLVYAGYGQGEDMNLKCSPELVSGTEVFRDEYVARARDIKRQEHIQKKRTKKWKQTGTHKLNLFYSTPAIKSYRVKPVRGLDGKFLKNIGYNMVLDAVEFTIGGHKGILDMTTKLKNIPSYIAKWITVDVDGNFEFMGKNYTVTDPRYAVENKAHVGSNADFTNKAKFEKILCIYTVNKDLLFYDEQINPVHADTTGETS